jgi:hypothetical protein
VAPARDEASALEVAGGSELTVRIEEARRRLDAHVREMVQWHFDPKTGCPFWLERAAELGLDPRKEVGGYADLGILGHFQDEWLRGGPVRRWVPRGMADRPLYVFETGGSTGVPKCRVNIEDFQTDYEIFGNSLADDGFPHGADWLMLGPTGPRRLRLAIEHLAQHRGGIAFFVDLDPRWVNKMIRARRFQDLDAYKSHVVDQALTVLRAHDSIRCLFTTPKLLEALCEKVSLGRLGITGIFCGGTEMNAQFHRFAREELVPGIDFVPTYGNTLMGLASPKPFNPADNYSITYYPPHPRAVFEIVDPDDLDRTVAYGERGRVLLTTLTREFFMPRFPERDEGGRAEPCDIYPWDGVRDLGLLSALQESVTVGVY